MVGFVVSICGVVLSLSLYLLSIGQPPPADPDRRALVRPYHDVDSGDYRQTKWWYEEEENNELLPDADGSPSVILEGHVALITGGNSGIGAGVAIELCKLGVGAVVITSRSIRRGEVAAKEMISKGHCEPGQIEAMEVDLADFESVRKLATDFRKKYDRLNYFVENAGGIIIPGVGYQGPYVTEEGFEALYAGNYLGHFLLLHQLLDLIETSNPARISITSSIAHWGATTNLTSLLPINGYDARKSQENDNMVNAFQQYCNTKFLQIAMAFELQDRLPPDSNITITPVAPGFVNTNIPSANRDKYGGFPNPLALNIKDGAKSTLHALFSHAIEGQKGFFLQPYWTPLHQSQPLGPLGLSVLLWEWAFQKLSWGCFLWLPHPNLHQRSFQKQLWEESLQAVGF
jgi:NAD(P)-dependent dehydrogenase (short-subunit alcohol dehydrogenase family)